MSASDLNDILQEAKDYLRVKPSKSISLLEQQAGQIHILPAETQINWHITMVRAAQQKPDLDRVARALNALLQLKGEPEFHRRFVSIVNAFGVWFRKSGYSEAARQAYSCALDHSNNNRQLLSILVNIAVTYRNLGKLELAIKINKLALNFASQINSRFHQAVVENNLGVLYLSLKQYEQAAKYFLTALNINQELSRQSGQVLTGLNLMLTYLHLHKDRQYQRVYPRIQRLISSDTHIARNAYMQLVHNTFLFRQGRVLSAENKTNLERAFSQLNDGGLQQSLLPISQELGLHIQLKQAPNRRTYNGPWLTEFKQCNWEKYNSNKYVHTLPHFLKRAVEQAK